MPDFVQATVDLPDFLALARARWSPYRYAEMPVAPDDLRVLFEAARWAPSSRNEQPWRFVLGVKGEGAAHAHVLGVLNERNRAWAQHAPVLGVACAFKLFARYDTPNTSARYDTGAAVATLALAAAARGLALHQMGGFDAEAAHEALHLPEDAVAVVAFALGYPAPEGEGADDLPEDIARRDARRRDRRCLAELVFSGV